MQFEGGYRYPSALICLILSIISFALASIIWLLKCLSIHEGLSLFLGLEGTSLLASAYTPVGLNPPSGNFWARLKWFTKANAGVPVSFNQLIFYAGLFCLFLSFLLIYVAI